MFTRGKPHGGAHGVQHPKFLRIVWGAPRENKNLLHSLVEKHLQTGNHRATAFSHSLASSEGRRVVGNIKQEGTHSKLSHILRPRICRACG